MHLRSRMLVIPKNVKLYPAFWKYVESLMGDAQTPECDPWKHYDTSTMCTLCVIYVLEEEVDTPLSKFICFWNKLSDSLGVLKVQVTKYRFLHVAVTAADAVIRHLGPSMSNSRAWNIDAPPQQNANNSQECQTLPGVSLIYVIVCVIVCRRFTTMRPLSVITALLCVLSVWSMCDRLYTIPLPCGTYVYSLELLMCVWTCWKQKSIHLSANSYVFGTNNLIH